MANNKFFGEKEYTEIHNLVLEYQNGNNKAIEELLSRFNIFINKFIVLIKDGVLIDHSSALINFLKFFIVNEEDRRKINVYTVSKKDENIKIYLKIFSIINNALKIIKKNYAHIEVEDAAQISKIAFIMMCKNYKQDKPSFHTYISKNFHYYFFRVLKTESSDYILNSCETSFTNVVEDTEYFRKANENFIISETDIITTLYLKELLNKKYIMTSDEDVNIYEDTFLDEKWVAGDTCSSVFLVLTPLERSILSLWYIFNYTDTQIGELLHYARPNINKKKMIAKRKLEKNCIIYKKILQERENF